MQKAGIAKTASRRKTPSAKARENAEVEGRRGIATHSGRGRPVPRPPSQSNQDGENSSSRGESTNRPVGMSSQERNAPINSQQEQISVSLTTLLGATAPVQIGSSRPVIEAPVETSSEKDEIINKLKLEVIEYKAEKKKTLRAYRSFRSIKKRAREEDK